MARLHDVLLADELTELIQFTSRISGLDIHEIIGKNRHQSPVYFRHILWYFLSEDLRLTQEQIQSSWPTWYDRSSISHGINSVRNSLDDPERADGIVRVLGRIRRSMQEIPFEFSGLKRVWRETNDG